MCIIIYWVSSCRSHLYSILKKRFTNEEIETYLKSKNIKYTRFEDAELFDKITDKLIEPEVVGLSTGRVLEREVLSLIHEMRKLKNYLTLRSSKGKVSDHLLQAFSKNLRVNTLPA